MRFVRKELSTAYTVDIEVEETHSYQLSNGLVSHNTVSLLCNATPGIHYPHSEYYLRRVRVSDTSPLVEVARKAGYPIEPDTYSDDTAVVSFPIFDPHFVKGKDEVSIWEQFQNAADMQRHWSDNQVSCLTGDTLVSTSHGLMPMQKLPELMKLPSIPGTYAYKGPLKALNADNQWSTISALVINPPKPLLQIEMEGLKKLRGTPEHRIRCLGKTFAMEWVKLHNVNPGDYIEEILNTKIWGSENDFEADNVFRKVLKVVPSPAEITYDLTVDQGHSYIANGFASHNCTISFKSSEARDLKACLEAYEDQLKSVSVLPLSEHGYVQAPYETITKETYLELMTHIIPMEMAAAQPAHDTDEVFCTNDSCTLPPAMLEKISLTGK